MAFGAGRFVHAGAGVQFQNVLNRNDDTRLLAKTFDDKITLLSSGTNRPYVPR